jgi:cell wall-associated NlpC family hydrolase
METRGALVASQALTGGYALHDLDALIGKKFGYGGRGPDTFDCYGLCIEAYRLIGSELPETGSAVMPSVIDRLVEKNRPEFTQIERPTPFCLVTFSIKRPYTSHIGIVLDDCIRFLHIEQKMTACIERLDSPLWQRRITGYFEYKR